MKICPKCNGTNPDQAEFCRLCGAKLQYNLTIKCPHCGRLCSLDRKRCPNCGTQLPTINGKPKLKLLSPHSWLGNKKLLIKFGAALVIIAGILSVIGVLSNSTYIFHASAGRKIQISYQDQHHQTIRNEYYDVRTKNRNYANYFGGKHSYWHQQRVFNSTAYYYGTGKQGYRNLWRTRHGKVLARYRLSQRAGARENVTLIKRAPRQTIRLVSSERNQMKFLDQYNDSGTCHYPGRRDLRYYQLRTFTQY
ncbi:double zinc ribbon domain-containing protein [Limosilactobacillus antri]|uniref:double zinc ribbon domain-containing protein n=1 Tax=Limosilactobacillus antri TaxID=227943 RepID=UPI001F5831B4|nr:zinc ribbon domain-containing protein [Limosilactobacillus antri]